MIPDEVESAKTNENIKSSDPTYTKKRLKMIHQHMIAYNERFGNNPNMMKVPESIIVGKYKGTRDIGAIPVIAEHKEDEIQCG